MISIILLKGTQCINSTQHNKSKFSTILFLFLFSFIITTVLSKPTKALFKPSTTSFSAMWYKYKFFLTFSGRFYNTLVGVWIGGTPASCKIASYYEKSILERLRYLSLLNIPFSYIFLRASGL